MQNRKVDLLGEDARGNLIHIELQSTNGVSMPLRMAEYALGVLRQHGRLPKQIVIYVGNERLRMDNRLRGGGLSFSYDLIDMREVDAEPLLASPNLSDNIVALLGRVKNRRVAVRRILRRIAEAKSGRERADRLQQLSILAGLRRMEGEIEREVQTVPIVIDIMENKIIGPAIVKGWWRVASRVWRRVASRVCACRNNW